MTTALTAREQALVRLAVRECRRQEGGEAEWLPVPAAAKQAGVAQSTIWEWMNRGLIPFAQVNQRGRRKIRAEVLDEFLAGHEGYMPQGASA